jgi:acyl-CoA thioesterase YciA
MSEPYLAIQVMMLPKDTNHHGTIFGGILLSYIDLAGAIGARRDVILAGGPAPQLVTIAMDRVEFHKPVLVGDIVSFYSKLLRIGRTSITVHVTVFTERNGQSTEVTEAEVTYVGIDPSSKERTPVPLLPDAEKP